MNEVSVIRESKKIDITIHAVALMRTFELFSSSPNLFLHVGRQMTAWSGIVVGKLRI